MSLEADVAAPEDSVIFQKYSHVPASSAIPAVVGRLQPVSGSHVTP